MAVLYLVEQGATLRKDSGTLVVSKESQILQKIPALKVNQVVVFGNVNLTTPVITYLLDHGIDCVFCSTTGRYHGRLFSTESKFGLLRQAQFQAVSNEAAKRSIAIQMVRAKLSNQRTMLMRYARERSDASLESAIAGLQSSIERLEKASDVPSVQGIEGYASTLYYGAFRTVLKQDLGFRGRVRRPPRDPVNSLLSFGYTLLVYGIQAAIRTVGLDPFLGFLHATEYSKPSLALDLMEEFRPIIVDSVVLRMINNNILTAEDFEPSTERQGMIRLKQEAIKAFLRYYEERVQTEVVHPDTDTRATYRRCFELQARQLARVITGKDPAYRPFLVK
ncbi:MAG: CRISPR-associated endonuclease Cas1 [Dehalococcoidia bacterium]|nr:CRISPR-associated endonuclease Cas1 [Dehalococcoidia bacterium]